MRNQRAQFRSSYYYSPRRPQYPFNSIGNPGGLHSVRPGNASSTTSKLSSTKLFATIIVIGFVTILGTGKLLHHTFASPFSSKPAPSSVKNAASTNVTSVDQMAASINQVISQNPAIDISVAIIDINNKQTYTYGETSTFLACSTGKLISASYLLRQVDNQQDSLSNQLDGDSTNDLLHKMIVDSDNDAWLDINQHLGHPNLEAFGKSIGMSDYDVDNNILKPIDIATLLNQLWAGTLLSKSSTDTLLGLMKQANRTDFALAALPSNVTAYHKAGWLDDHSHDAVIVDDGKRPYIMVVFTKSADSSQTNQRISVIHQITNATVAHFIDKDTAAKLATS